jgi:hypothetical protein
MSIDTRTSRLVTKTGVEKSGWTVPLRSLSILIERHQAYTVRIAAIFPCRVPASPSLTDENSDSMHTVKS